ncbi:MAG: hypothetical protein R3F40_02880 [Candidatus Competibacteraceae bacterium]
MKTAQSLDGQNLAGKQTFQRGGDDIVHFDRCTLAASRRLRRGPQTGQALGWA